MTIASILIIFYLILGEWSEYRKILVMPELIVDKGRGESLIVQCSRSATECSGHLAHAEVNVLTEDKTIQARKWRYT